MSERDRIQFMIDTKNKIESAMKTIRHKILVMSGKGGVGKTTVSVNLAVALAEEGFRVGLLDIDLHGPNVVTMTGYSVPPDVDGTKIIPAKTSDNLKVVSMAYFLEEGRPTIWRGPIKISAINQFLGDVEWGELDFLLIDSPPGSGDEPLTVMQQIPDVKVIVVTTPQRVAIEDVRRSLNFALTMNKEVIGVVENMAYMVCPHCGGEIRMYGSGNTQTLSDEFNVPILASVPFDPAVVELSDSGRPIVSWYRGSNLEKVYRDLVAKVIERLEKGEGTRSEA
ncbi:MAG: ATP-binding protein involved in chromosome partitioning [Thermotogota bacterium]|nr:ATP-binding protein involved in chromosome partitioning [Thermotogota bacterium]